MRIERTPACAAAGPDANARVTPPACSRLRRLAGQLALVGALAGLHVTAAAQQAVPPLPDLRFSEIRARAAFEGDRWSYMEAGARGSAPVVMLHGIGGTSIDWRFQLADLARDFHVVAWNAPGYMLTDGFRKQAPGCRDYADALADFLDSVGLNRVALVGHSFGTRVAQCFAIHYPARISRLVLVGVGIGPKGLPEEEKTKARAARAAQVAAGGYGFGARADALVGPNTTPALMELVRNGTRATSPRGLMQAFELTVADGYSPEQVAGAVRVPLLLISGSADRVNPIATNAALLKKSMPAARLEIIDAMGHMPQVESPEHVNRLLREFLAAK